MTEFVFPHFEEEIETSSGIQFQEHFGSGRVNRIEVPLYSDSTRERKKTKCAVPKGRLGKQEGLDKCTAAEVSATRSLCSVLKEYLRRARFLIMRIKRAELLHRGFFLAKTPSFLPPITRIELGATNENDLAALDLRNLLREQFDEILQDFIGMHKNNPGVFENNLAGVKVIPVGMRRLLLVEFSRSRQTIGQFFQILVDCMNSRRVYIASTGEFCTSMSQKLGEFLSVLNMVSSCSFVEGGTDAFDEDYKCAAHKELKKVLNAKFGEEKKVHVDALEKNVFDDGLLTYCTVDDGENGKESVSGGGVYCTKLLNKKMSRPWRSSGSTKICSES